MYICKLHVKKETVNETFKALLCCIHIATLRLRELFDESDRFSLSHSACY